MRILETGGVRVNSRVRPGPPVLSSAASHYQPCEVSAVLLGKIVLWVSTIAFVGYGLQCLISPQVPADFAGLAIVNGDGYAELGAMYGGLQTGFGILCLLGALREDLFKPVLTAVALVIGSLAVGRLYSAVTAPDPVAAYTWGATAYEFATAILAVIALKKA